MVSVGVGREHERVSVCCKSAASLFVLKTVATSIKENLLGGHLVEVENTGKDEVLFVETLIFPGELPFSSDFRG